MGDEALRGRGMFGPRWEVVEADELRLVPVVEAAGDHLGLHGAWGLVETEPVGDVIELGSDGQRRRGENDCISADP